MYYGESNMNTEKIIELLNIRLSDRQLTRFIVDLINYRDNVSFYQDTLTILQGDYKDKYAEFLREEE